MIVNKIITMWRSLWIYIPAPSLLTDFHFRQHPNLSKRVKNVMNAFFMPPLCTYRLNWARRTSWGWWDECDNTALQTQDSKIERSRGLINLLEAVDTIRWTKSGSMLAQSFKPPGTANTIRGVTWWWSRKQHASRGAIILWATGYLVDYKI